MRKSNNINSNNSTTKDFILEKLIQTKFGEHNFILYSEIAALRNIYIGYCKTALESLNEIVLLLPYYESVVDVYSNLRNDDGGSGSINVEKYKKEGSLVVVESKRGYFSLTNELIGITIMIKMLLQRASKLKKSAVSVISDMGLFFYMNRIEELIKHETKLPSLIYDMKVKIFCCYNSIDLKRLPEQQMQQLLNNHNNIISTEEKLI